MTDEQAWAPEPLSHDGVWFVDANGHQLGGQEAHNLSKPTINRLLACYNACAGIPILERMSKPMFKRQAINNAACKDISEEVLIRVVQAGGFGKIIQGLMQQKFPDYEGHWEQQFLNDSEEAPDA